MKQKHNEPAYNNILELENFAGDSMLLNELDTSRHTYKSNY